MISIDCSFVYNPNLFYATCCPADEFSDHASIYRLACPKLSTQREARIIYVGAIKEVSEMCWHDHNHEAQNILSLKFVFIMWLSSWSYKLWF